MLYAYVDYRYISELYILRSQVHLHVTSKPMGNRDLHTHQITCPNCSFYMQAYGDDSGIK